MIKGDEMPMLDMDDLPKSDCARIVIDLEFGRAKLEYFYAGEWHKTLLEFRTMAGLHRDVASINARVAGFTSRPS